MSALREGEATAGLSWLPADLAEFVGRDREIEQLAAWLKPDGAAAVIAGMPGSGKTALAAHLARSVPGFASSDVAFATASDLKRHGFDLKRYSAPLLIADGLRKHEIDAVLADRDRPAHVLVTTRDLGYEPAAGSLIRLAPLNQDEATLLLGFLAGPERVSRDGDGAAEIVRLCGGLPLALRVAGRQLAGRPRTGLREFAEQMRRRRWRDESRQGVANAIDDARLTLPDAARRAFPLLAVAGETFPRGKWEAIVEVLDRPDVSGPAGPVGLADALVHAGLLESQGDGVWRAHPLIVSFAQARLSRDAALRTAAAAAMIRWHARAGLTEASVADVLRAVQVAGAWAPRTAIDDLVAVADSALVPLWDKRMWPQWEQLHRAVRTAADRALEPALQTRTAANQVIGYLAQHRLTEAASELRHAAQSRPDGFPPESCARLWLHEVTLRRLQGDLDGAERLVTRALAEANQIKDAGMVLLARMTWAHLERDRGNVRAAVAQWTDIARDATREALPEVQTLALIRAAKGSVELGTVDRARDLLAQAVTVAAGAVPHEAIALAEQARLEQANGHADRAYASARRAATLQSGAVEGLETGPSWVWWPRPVHYAVPAAVATIAAVLAVAGGAAVCAAWRGRDRRAAGPGLPALVALDPGTLDPASFPGDPALARLSRARGRGHTAVPSPLRPPGRRRSMNQRQERQATRTDDFSFDEVSAAIATEEELPEYDIDLRPFDAQSGEPQDPLEAAPAFAAGDPFKDFSDNARERYELEVSSYAADLRKQALARKRSHGRDNVSGRDVVSAAYFLHSYRSHRYLKYLGAVGGVLFGLGAQTLVGMVEKGVYTTGSVLWGAGTALAGIALFVWHVAHKSG